MSAATPDGESASPANVLRGALSAACRQDAGALRDYLTARSSEALAHMSASARLEFMKHLVLLDQPGKPSVSTLPSGRLEVRCETPSVTTLMQLGTAELRDNLAYVPMDLRNAADSSGADAQAVTMGLVRENGRWKLLSLGVLMLDLPQLEAEWSAADMKASEENAILGVKRIADAVELYRRTYTRIPDTLEKLAAPAQGPAGPNAAGVLDADLARGAQEGYVFRYVLASASETGAPAKYEISATPVRYGATGLRSFFRDTAGRLHAADHHGAVGSDADPVLP